MVDIESIYADLCEYLGDQRVKVNLRREPELEVHHEQQEQHGGDEEEHPLADDSPADERDLVRKVLTEIFVDKTNPDKMSNMEFTMVEM